MKQPTQKDINEFTGVYDSLTVQAANRLTNRGRAVIQAMSDSGVSDSFDFKGMAITTQIHEVERLLIELKSLEFNNDCVNPIIEEITRPFGS